MNSRIYIILAIGLVVGQGLIFLCADSPGPGPILRTLSGKPELEISDLDGLPTNRQFQKEIERVADRWSFGVHMMVPPGTVLYYDNMCTQYATTTQGRILGLVINQRSPDTGWTNPVTGIADQAWYILFCPRGTESNLDAAFFLGERNPKNVNYLACYWIREGSGGNDERYQQLTTPAELRNAWSEIIQAQGTIKLIVLNLFYYFPAGTWILLTIIKLLMGVRRSKKGGASCYNI